MNYKEIFIGELGKPDNENKLDEYIEFLVNYKQETLEYTENHHILPKSKFKSYKTSEKNLVTLLYSDHIIAHRLLAEAYNIHSFVTPLNFMSENKDLELKSKTHKKWWKEFKNTNEYNNWLEQRKKSLIKYKELYSYLMTEKNNRRFSDIKEKEKVSKLFKDLWADEEYREKMMIIRKEQATEQAKKNIAKGGKERYDNMTTIERENFRNKMRAVNSSEEKRNKTSKTLQKNWKNPDFRKKQEEIRKEQMLRGKGKKQYKITKNNNVIICKGFGDMIETYNFNAKLVRKFMNTNEPVTSNSNAEKSKNTIGYIFEEIK